MNPLLMLAILPLLVASLGLVPRLTRWLPWAAAALMLIQIPVVVLICIPVMLHSAVHPGVFALDGMGVAFTIITTLVAAAAMVQAAFLLPAERARGDSIPDRRFRLFYVLSMAFVLAMYAVPLAQHIGYLWMMVEATTLVSAPLIDYHHNQKSLEATWKYLILCSVGIAFALFGTVLIVAAQHTLPNGETMLLGDLMARAKDLDPRLLRLGFVFCLLGYGTKAGLFPLHHWLPDAHSEAPSPASALLSGALLNCALVAIWRLSGVLVAAGQSEFVHRLLVPAGAITVFAASLMLVRQHDLKRMLAYSSVEHVGLLTLAIGIGSGPIFILHAFNHSIVKVALFLMAGGILSAFGTRSLRRLGGVLNASPAWGIVLLAGTFAIAGSPPFGTFISEWLLLRDAFAAGEMAAALVVILGLTITCVALTTHAGRVALGHERVSARSAPVRMWAFVPAALVVVSITAGLAITPSVIQLLGSLVRNGT